MKKNTLKKVFTTSLLLLGTLALTACSSGGLDVSKTDSETKTSTDSNRTKDVADNLKINYAVGNNLRTLTYNQSTPITMPDGTVISSGDLKPMWQYVSDQLGFSIEDVAVQNQTGDEMMQIASATGFTDATIYGGAKASTYQNYGPKGYLVNLKEYLSEMPNLKKYLEENPNIEKAISSYDGGIYYIPYVAELGNYARTFNGRESWITLLLDGESLEGETTSLPIEYEGYWDIHSDNIIALQNAAATNGQLDRDTALNILKDYIKKEYPDLDKPSDLYLGSKAEYDMDELVALWRVMKLSPNTLSKAATGAVVPDAIISPFFTRDSGNREDVLRLINYFGGQRIYGSDDFNSLFYIDEKGELQFSLTQDGSLEGMSYLKQLYDEGLIFSEFADSNNKDKFRTMMYSSDKNEGQKQFGFMTIDWIASTTATNEDVVSIVPPVTTLGDSKERIHFMENSRTIKSEAWSISQKATDEEKNAAFKLFDYFFTKEGNLAQNYGVPEMIETDGVFEGPDGKEYPKYKDWVFENANALQNGDLSVFLRDFIGSQMPIGYQKEIGFEYQYTVNKGFESWDIYDKGEVITPSYDAKESILQLTPTDYSFSEQEQAKLATTSVGPEQKDNIFLYVTGSENGPKDPSEIKDLYEKAGIDEYIKMYRSAFERSQEVE